MPTAPVLALDAPELPGWYGKLSCLGDFAQRRLPPECARACDAWLSAAMRGGREQLGERWLPVYLTAPLLRFAWAPGVIDSLWWFGVLMPSCDRAGRYFPLLIAQARTRPPQDRIALDHLELWFDCLADAAMHTLHDSAASVDALEAALMDAPPWPTPWPTPGAGPALSTRMAGLADVLRLPSGTPLSQWLHALAASELAAHLVGCTIWWRVATTGPQDSAHIVHGLPQGAAFVELLGG